MIDWDELLEDVNWGRTIALLVAGILVIVVVILVLMDYTKARNLEIQLETDLDTIEITKSELRSPGKQQLKQIEQDIKNLQQRLDQNSVQVPGVFRPEEIKNQINSLAANNNVNVISVSHPEWETRKEGYAIIRTINVEFTSRRLGNARSFIDGLDRLPYPVTVEYPQLNAGNRMECTISLFVFDQEKWESDNVCEPDVDFPDIPLQERKKDYKDIFLSYFKEGPKEILEKVEREQAGLKDVKADFQEYCELKTQREKFEVHLDILKKAGE